MYVNKIAIIFLSCLFVFNAEAQDTSRSVSPQPSIMTIGQLSEQARQKRIAEETMKSEPKLAAPNQGSPPPGMTIVPSTQILKSDAVQPNADDKHKKTNKPKPEKKEEFIPTILAIYKSSRVHYVELLDSNGVGRFKAGNVTESGWSILSITSSGVEVGKADPKTGTMRKLNIKVSAG